MPERTRVAICGVSVRSSWPGGEPAVLKTWVQSLHAFDLRLLHPGGPVGALRTILRYRAKGLYGYDYYVEELRRFAPDLCVGFTDYDLSYVLAARDLGIPLILNVQTHWMACPIQSAFDFKGEYHPQASLPRCLYCTLRQSDSTGKGSRKTEYMYNAFMVARLQSFFAYRNLIRHVNAFVVPSVGMKQEIAGVGVPTGTIRVIPNGVDVNLWSPKDVPETPRTVLFYSLPNRLKGINYFTELAARFSDRRDVRFISTGNQNTALPNLKYIGWRSQDEIVDFVRDSHIVVVPSVWEEPFGLVCTQAMSCGKVVVGFDVMGLRQQITDGETGFLIRKGDSDGLFHRIRMLIDQPDLIARIGENARRHAVENFDVNRSKASYLEVVEGALRR